MAAPDPITRGIALRIFAAGTYSLMTGLLKFASTDHVAAIEMLFYRATCGLPVVMIWVMANGGLRAIRTERPWAHLTRCTLGIISISLTFQSLILLPLADATTIGFTSPIFATILSWLVLREPVGRHRWLAVILGFIGVAIVMRPGATSHAVPLLGVAVALMAALGQASVTITLRQIGGTEHVAAIVFWFFISSIVVAGLFMPFFASWHTPATYLLLAGAGVCGGLMQLALTASLQSAPVSVIAPFDYLQIVGATIFGWLVLGSPPTINTLGGAALIAGSGLYTAWREHRRRRDPHVPPTQSVA
ncbi:DMT family transporter [Sphingomonas naphthae]|uniref:DMT family transporter n=1 Tax=Sphingomonas naphthae TaxID=1813468 RepID=A0ABY7TJE8_9SPHN|nr:DMT family transporter [Sphingomonas naphthae]WCT72535.1 DMT family transporter [Sphingomonas naphthae]